MTGICRKCGPVSLRRRAHNLFQCVNIVRPARNEQLKKLYGITIEQYEEMVMACDSRCHICGVKIETPHVDHNHLTGEIRGLLCGNHNRGLGLFGDDPELLRAAAAYLEGSL